MCDRYLRKLVTSLSEVCPTLCDVTTKELYTQYCVVSPLKTTRLWVIHHHAWLRLSDSATPPTYFGSYCSQLLRRFIRPHISIRWHLNVHTMVNSVTGSTSLLFYQLHSSSIRMDTFAWSTWFTIFIPKTYPKSLPWCVSHLLRKVLAQTEKQSTAKYLMC